MSNPVFTPAPARMKNPVMILPDAMAAMQALNGACERSGVPARTLELVHVRASQINGCALCIDLHLQRARKGGEADQRMLLVSAWRDTPYFTAAERAALALTEAVTRIADRAEPVADDVWAEAARHYDERALSGLLLAISAINVWNRLNVATRQSAGSINW